MNLASDWLNQVLKSYPFRPGGTDPGYKTAAEMVCRSKIPSDNVTFCPHVVGHTKKSENARYFYY